MIIYSSDGSNSHPKGYGPAGAAVVRQEEGVATRRYPFTMRYGTNNRAEMYGFLQMVILAYFNEEPCTPITFRTDSQWVERIVAGHMRLTGHQHYKLKEGSREFSDMLQIIHRFWNTTWWTLEWVPREENEEADEQSKFARETAKSWYV